MGRAFEVRKKSMQKTDAARVRIYSKYGKEIYLAAKGNPDPVNNLELKRIIENARKDEVTNEIINRAIKRAKGGFQDDYTEMRYEGFGPGGSMVIVECLTDNVNRTVANVRNCFTKTNGNLGVTGSVVHMFNHQSVFAIKGISEEEILEIMINNEIDVDDIEADSQGISIIGNDTDYNLIRTSIIDYNKDVEFITDDILWLPIMEINIDKKDDLDEFNKLINMLEEVEDVKDVYHNVNIEED